MPSNNVLALDVGEKRVGVALARAQVKVPVALETLDRQAEDFWDKLANLCKEYEIAEIVVGLPRNMEGEETEQTKATQRFAEELKERIELPLVWQDEAVTSVKAREVLEAGGKDFEKKDVDALAATIILSDYLSSGGSSE